jgi:hypothetical protein
MANKWDAARTDSRLSISVNGLVIRRNAAASTYAKAMATLPCGAQKRAWMATIGQGNVIGIGVAAAGENSSDGAYLGALATSAAIYHDAWVQSGPATGRASHGFGVGDKVRVEFDGTTGRVEFFVNDASVSILNTSLRGDAVPAVNLTELDAIVSASFSPSVVSAGFSAWDDATPQEPPVNSGGGLDIAKLNQIYRRSYKSFNELALVNLGEAGGQEIEVRGRSVEGDCEPFYMHADPYPDARPWDGFSRTRGADGVPYEISLRPEMHYSQFGADGRSWQQSVNNDAAFAALKALMIARCSDGETPVIRLDGKQRFYRHDNPLVLSDGKANVRWRWHGGGGGVHSQKGSGGGGGFLINENGNGCMFIDHMNTYAGGPKSEGMDPMGGDCTGTEVLGVSFWQRRKPRGGVGLYATCRGRFNDCVFSGWDFGMIVAATCEQLTGNANSFHALRNVWQYCRVGSLFYGTCINASSISGSWYFNEEVGLWSLPFLDLFAGDFMHFESNGLDPNLYWNPDYEDYRPSFVQHNGIVWRCAPGQHAQASVTAPGVDNNWEYCFPSWEGAPYKPWANGLAVIGRSALWTGNPNAVEVYTDCYFESDQWIDIRSKAHIGGGCTIEMNVSRNRHGSAIIERDNVRESGGYAASQYEGPMTRNRWISRQMVYDNERDYLALQGTNFERSTRLHRGGGLSRWADGGYLVEAELGEKAFGPSYLTNKGREGLPHGWKLFWHLLIGDGEASYPMEIHSGRNPPLGTEDAGQSDWWIVTEAKPGQVAVYFCVKGKAAGNGHAVWKPMIMAPTE